MPFVGAAVVGELVGVVVVPGCDPPEQDVTVLGDASSQRLLDDAVLPCASRHAAVRVLVPARVQADQADLFDHEHGRTSNY